MSLAAKGKGIVRPQMHPPLVDVSSDETECNSGSIERRFPLGTEGSGELWWPRGLGQTALGAKVGRE